VLGLITDQLTDVQLAQVCKTDEAKAGDIVGLAGCATIRDTSCLILLEQMQESDIFGCTGIDAMAVAKVVAANRTLSKLIFGGKQHDQYDPEPVILEVGMTEVHFGDKNLGLGGGIIISAWIIQG
jgi:hypothetical protein